MEYIYSSLLLHKLGKEINEENLKKVMEAAGAEVDEARIKAVISSLKDVNIEDALKQAASVPAAQPAASGESASEQKEDKKEEKKEEKKPEEGAAGLANLFG